MQIKRIPAGVYSANCYLIFDEKSKECAVIDPGGDADDIIETLKTLEAKVKYILLTHGHFDHTGAAAQLSEEFNTSIYINRADGELILEGAYTYAPIAHKGKNAELIMEVSDKSKFTLGDNEISCIETPGHTPGGVCYLTGKEIFTGDTLFLRSIGRTDLFGGDYDTLITSIQNKLMVLPDDIVVYPGHGPQSTIKYERANNPFI